MKVSFLILAHNNFIHLERLIDQLNDGKCRMYIHMDAKTTIPYHLTQKPNVHFIENRVKVYWAGFATIRAILNLMEYALNDEPADYFSLISGVDFPLKTNEALYKKLEEGGEYINMLPPGKTKPMSWFTYHYFDGFERKAIFNPKTQLYYLLETLMKIIPGKKKIPFQLYFGSAWFTLSRGCVQYIIDTTTKSDKYQRFFAHVLMADETFFQTIIGNSPYKHHVKQNLTYTDWSTKPAPAIITVKHVELLKNNPTFTGIYGTFTPYFARKFNDEAGQAVELIKQKLH
jgi:hypothetical protein